MSTHLLLGAHVSRRNLRSRMYNFINYIYVDYLHKSFLMKLVLAVKCNFNTLA